MKRKFYICAILVFICFIKVENIHGQGSLFNIDLKGSVGPHFSGRGMLGSVTDSIWNEIYQINTNNLPVHDAKGDLSSVTFSSNGINGTWPVSSLLAWGNFQDYWYLLNSGTTAIITFNNIAVGDPFELIVYSYPGGNGRNLQLSVNGSSTMETSGWGNQDSIPWIPYPDRLSNYISFADTVPANGTITLQLTCVNSEADVNGIQLQVGNISPPARGLKTNQLVPDLKAGYDVKVMTMGTSLTWWGISPWPSLMMNSLRNIYNGNIILYNEGVAATNSNFGVSNVENWVQALNPDVVFIEYGMNDAVAASNISLSKVYSNLDTIASAILSNNPNADIIIQTMNNCEGGNFAARPDLVDYYQVYRNFAAFRGFTLIDNYTLWMNLWNTDPSLWVTYVNSDSIHPTLEGDSIVELRNIVKTLENAFPRAAAPAFAPASDTITTSQSISINTLTSGSGIYYTIDGSIPTPNCTQYSGPFQISKNTTIKAIAMKDSMNCSVVSIVNYVLDTSLILSAPTELISTTITQTSFTLSWDSSADNYGVTEYYVYKNAIFLDSSKTNSLNVTGLNAATTYSMTVKAKDSVGNFSPLSNVLLVTTSSITGLGNINNTADVYIYPNPAKSFITIENLDLSDINVIKILDISGQIVINQLMQNNSNFDVSMLKSGLYIVKISNTSNIIITKLRKE